MSWSELKRGRLSANHVSGGVAIVAAALIAMSMAAAGPAPNASPASSVPAASPSVVWAPPEIVYSITGSAVSVTYTAQTPTGMAQGDADVPLTNKSGSKGLRFTGFSPGDFLYISAQNQGGGSVTCSISQDGLVISENTATGDYAIASCDGSLH